MNMHEVPRRFVGSARETLVRHKLSTALLGASAITGISGGLIVNSAVNELDKIHSHPGHNLQIELDGIASEDLGIKFAVNQFTGLQNAGYDVSFKDEGVETRISELEDRRNAILTSSTYREYGKLGNGLPKAAAAVILPLLSFMILNASAMSLGHDIITNREKGRKMKATKPSVLTVVDRKINS